MNHPLVSIVIPYYNKKDTILRSVNSVLHQTYQNWELTIIDDCGTEQIDKNNLPDDARIKFLYNQNNLGAARTRQRGLDASKGEFIAFLDADDWWENFFLEKCVTQLESKKSYSGAYVISKVHHSDGTTEIRRYSNLGLVKIRESLIQFARPWQTGGIVWRKSKCGNWGINKTHEDSWFEVNTSKNSNFLYPISEILYNIDSTIENSLSKNMSQSNSVLDQQELFIMLFEEFWEQLSLKYKIILFHRLIRGHLKIHEYCPEQIKFMGSRLIKLNPWLFFFKNQTNFLKLIHRILQHSPFKIYY